MTKKIKLLCFKVEIIDIFFKFYASKGRSSHEMRPGRNSIFKNNCLKVAN